MRTDVVRLYLECDNCGRDEEFYSTTNAEDDGWILDYDELCPECADERDLEA